MSPLIHFIASSFSIPRGVCFVSVFVSVLCGRNWNSITTTESSKFERVQRKFPALCHGNYECILVTVNISGGVLVTSLFNSFKNKINFFVFDFAFVLTSVHLRLVTISRSEADCVFLCSNCHLQGRRSFACSNLIMLDLSHTQNLLLNSFVRILCTRIVLIFDTLMSFLIFTLFIHFILFLTRPIVLALGWMN
jgi:hypothetical protein